jgi:xyloglucan-specific endo-beta-1,4-glucanase
MRCATGATCMTGVCVCPNSGMACSGTCYDINNDEAHCGNCTTTCSGSTQCLFGGCVDPNSVNCAGSNTGRTCARNAVITLGKYWVNNNWWGVASGNNGSAACSATSNFQGVASRCQTGDLVGWATDWNWSGTGSVMTYASLVFGWQYDDFRIKNTGLPVQLSANRAVNCGWSFTVSGSGTMNVAYDMWLHSINNPTYNSQPSEEVMVWLYRGGGAGPVGSRQATVTIGGTSWDLYRGTTVQPVYSFVRTASATTAVLNMSAFLSDLVTRGWVQNSRYLSSVQAGTEIFTGSGSVTTNGFYCRVQ